MFDEKGFCGLYSDDAVEALDTGSFPFITRHLGEGIYFYVCKEEDRCVLFSKIFSFAEDVRRAKNSKRKDYEQVICLTADIYCEEDELYDFREMGERVNFFRLARDIEQSYTSDGTPALNFDVLCVHILNTMKVSNNIKITIGNFSQFYTVEDGLGVETVCVTSHNNIKHNTVKKVR